MCDKLKDAILNNWIVDSGEGWKLHDTEYPEMDYPDKLEYCPWCGIKL